MHEIGRMNARRTDNERTQDVVWQPRPVLQRGKGRFKRGRPRQSTKDVQLKHTKRKRNNAKRNC